jgi:eukaryotic-like serine/threonine-protein kinase
VSARRAPQAPPELPGFTYLDALGSGGFADVFLYEQALPHRRVAVKVLLTDRMSSGSVSEFTAEANVMAMLSTHPAIVTIYQAGVAADGRPYLVMEYCPKPNLQVRYRREPFSVAESLRVGVQVAGAVETAHRAGVLHRDIKPANILVTEYNRPALTDFGIASTTAAAGESAGLSIPWSPPESFAEEPRSDRRSDVYALGATVYTLLAGRSPFELNGQRNGAADLIQRIETTAVPALGRPDAPASLQHVLERAMAKSPADRYASALDFARALQKVQIELSHGVTPVDILDDAPIDEVADDDGDDPLTRVRGVVSIDPATEPAAGRTRPSAATAPAAAQHTIPTWKPSAPHAPVDETVLRAPVVPTDAPSAFSYAPRDVGDTIQRPPASVGEEEPVETTASATPHRRSRAGLWAGIAGGLLLVAVVAVGAIALPGLLGAAPSPSPSASESSEPVDVLPSSVAPPEALSGVAKGKGVVFTWKNPDAHDGDVFAWKVQVLGEETPFTKVKEPTITVPAQPGRTCLDVMVVRSDGRSSEPATECVP